MLWDCEAAGAPPLIPTGNDLTPARLFRFGAGRFAALCGAGEDADGVMFQRAGVREVGGPALPPWGGWPGMPGLPVLVEAGAAFTAGATLQSDASGRAIARTTGVAVLRALDAAAGAGSIVWAVFLSGR